MSAETAAQEQWDADFAELMKVPAFRRWLFTIVDNGGWCAVSGDPFEVDAAKTAYALGRRSIGVQLNVEAQRLAPNLVLRMLTEQQNLRTDFARAAEAEAETPEEP